MRAPHCRRTNSNPAAEAWTSEFHALHAEDRMMMVGMHSQLIGQPSRLKALRPASHCPSNLRVPASRMTARPYDARNSALAVNFNKISTGTVPERLDPVYVHRQEVRNY
jgi:hypothetical protein